VAGGAAFPKRMTRWPPSARAFTGHSDGAGISCSGTSTDSWLGGDRPGAAVVLYEAKQSRAVIVILAPVVQIPIELEKQFVVLVHDLPDLAQIEAIARVAVEPGELPGDPEAWRASSRRRPA